MNRDRPIVFLACRKNAGSALVAQTLARCDMLNGIIVESGIPAKKRKLRRIKQKTKIWEWPLVFFDLALLTSFSTLQERSLQKHVRQKAGTTDLPQTIPTYYVHDINDAGGKAVLRKTCPDILVVRGTGLLRTGTISLIRSHVLNIHGGIVPRYRNVHSEFWAYIRRDTRNIGVSILHLDSGIDSGDIAGQASIQFGRCDGIFEVKKKNIDLAAFLIKEVLLGMKNGIPRYPQEKHQTGFYPTPRTKEFIRLLWIQISNAVACRR